MKKSAIVEGKGERRDGGGGGRGGGGGEILTYRVSGCM